MTPALLRWRVLRQGTVVRRWHAPVDFRTGLIPKERFDAIYAPGTRQNHAGKPGVYRFYLAHTWSTGRLPNDDYAIEVEASDLAGNVASVRLQFTLANGL